MELKDLKEQYAKLHKKYTLPSFEEINEEFEVDKLEKDTDCLLRDIRKRMLDKFVNSMGFLESLVNPVNLSRIYMPYVKNMGSEDREDIEFMYGKISDISLWSLELEVDYSEKNEAELIKHMHKIWNEIKPRFRKMITKMRNPTEASAKKEKSYYG